MKPSLEVFHHLNKAQQMYVAQQVSDYTTGIVGGEVEMLPLTPKQVAAKLVGVVALGGDNEFMGYIAINTPDISRPNCSTEIGTLVVAQQFRGHRIAGRLVHRATSMAAGAGWQPYAFCNEKSLPIFQRAGYKKVSDECIPSSAFELCGSCPKVDLSPSCCNKRVIYDLN